MEDRALGPMGTESDGESGWSWWLVGHFRDTGALISSGGWLDFSHSLQGFPLSSVDLASSVPEHGADPSKGREVLVTVSENNPRHKEV